MTVSIETAVILRSIVVYALYDPFTHFCFRFCYIHNCVIATGIMWNLNFSGIQLLP